MSKTQIPNPQITSDRKIKFSFEFYDCTCDEYCLSSWNNTDVKQTLKRLKEINQKTIIELQQSGKVLHFHEVYWDKTIMKGGFPDICLKDMPAFQFSLLGINNQKARVYGALSSDVFYIVWFDHKHSIWPSFKSHT